MTGTIKITELPNAGVLDGTERVPVVMSGVTKQATTLQIAGLASVSAGTITIGTTPISGGVTTQVLYDNGGFVGEYAVSGSGSVAMTNSPTLVTPALGVPTSLTLTNAAGLPIGGISATGTPSASTFLRGDGSWAAAGVGSVTSVAQSFTGGLISVAGSPITSSGTLALTVAGTSGGVPYFSSSSAWASSAALAANALVIGGGAGAAPSTTTTGTGVITALGVNVGSAGALVVNGGALGTPASGTLTNVTGLPIGGISATGTPSASTFLRGDGSWQAVSVSPGGSTTQVQFNNAGAFAGDSGFTFSSSNKAITLGGATITASAPVLDLSQTWNSGGTTFTGWKLNVTDTASASASLLMDLQVGGSSKLSVNKVGYITVPANSGGIGTSSGNIVFSGTTTLFGVTSAADNDFASIQATGVFLRAAMFIGWTDQPYANTTPDLYLYRDAANTLALRNGTNAQTFRAYNTYTDSSNGEWLSVDWSTSANVASILTKKNGTGTQRALNLGASGAANWQISTSGHFLAAADNTYDIGASSSGRPHAIYAADSVTSGNTIRADGGYNSQGGVFWTIQTTGAWKVSSGGAQAGAVLYDPKTIANLPTPANGMVAAVTDALAPVAGATVASGGAAKALVWYNGANWTVIGV